MALLILYTPFFSRFSVWLDRPRHRTPTHQTQLEYGVASWGCLAPPARNQLFPTIPQECQARSRCSSGNMDSRGYHLAVTIQVITRSNMELQEVIRRLSRNLPLDPWTSARLSVSNNSRHRSYTNGHGVSDILVWMGYMPRRNDGCRRRQRLHLRASLTRKMRSLSWSAVCQVKDSTLYTTCSRDVD